MAEVGCARPTGASVTGEAHEETQTESTGQLGKEISMARAQVGKAAPDFQAPAYYKGEFTSVKLSDYLGKWVLLCFYPGDFTFV